MNLLTVLRFVFGNAKAIREVACNRAALRTGIALVLLTGIARNYDQTFFLESPMWLIGPLAFSFVSGSFLYWILIRGFARSDLPLDLQNEKRWTTFMALFWMTAPIAWIYAIPVERFFDVYHAAEANIVLLGVVSLWRVLLMSRIMSVLCELHFVRALGWVLVATSLEVIVVLFGGAIFSPTFSRGILAAMAGMRNAPEQALISTVLGNVWGWSWAVLFVSGLLLGIRPLRRTIHPLPKSSPGKVRWLPLVSLTVVWTVIAVGPQAEQHRFRTHAALIDKGAYSEAMSYLEKHRQSDFPPSRRLEPNPYEHRVWQDLPPTIALLKPDTAPWIRHVYLDHMTAMMSHYFAGYDSLTNVSSMLSAIERLPEGREWFQTNQVAFARQGLQLTHGRNESLEGAESIAKTNILATLGRLGMARTNLDKLTKD